MKISNRTETFALFIGDVVLLYLALFITLFIRYYTSEGFHLDIMLRLHLLPFTILFALFTLVFFIAGLYEKHTLFLQKQLPQLLSRALLVNILIAVAFFYFLPAFEIAPKANLFISLIVASLLLFGWRRLSLLRMMRAERERAVVVGTGEEMGRIMAELNGNPRYGIRCSFVLDTALRMPAEEALRKVREERVNLVIVDLYDAKAQSLFPHLYTLLFQDIRFADMHDVYEEMFDRIPLSLVRYPWFLEHISSTRFTYDVLKRLMDMVVSLILGALSLALYPIVYMAIKLDDGGPLFVHQERVGRFNRLVRTIKFRTMTRDDAGQTLLKRDNRVTRVGRVLRRTRIDELPQLWNVLQGSMSLIGPRPELPALVEVYEREVPYYNTRHILKPGLSGWAQIYHKNPPKVHANSDETAIKLSYDLYYLKNRSFWLDVKIALKTIKVLLSRSGV